MTVQQLYQWIDKKAPFQTQISYDNSGLLTGDPQQEITGVHFALDAVPAVVQEAIRMGANVIVTHHPLMFSPIKTLREDDPEAAVLCSLIRHHIALIAAHTNLDKAEGGMNDVLASVIGLRNISGEEFLRVGDLSEKMTAADFAADLGQRLHTVVRRMGPGETNISRVGVCSGAGSDEWTMAQKMGAQAFVTGECKHHHALAAAAAGMVMFECGHFATEQPGIFALADALQIEADRLK